MKQFAKRMVMGLVCNSRRGVFLLLGLAVFVSNATAQVTAESVVSHYADMALAKYQDSLTTAVKLDEAIAAFVESPSTETHAASKAAWLAARVPYQQTEVFRFGNAIVDDWEGRVNAWPLDEGLIDYVDAGYGSESDENALYSANVIASRSLLINGEQVNVETITPELLSLALHEAGGNEANVATGYHAIEFLLWGQDLNGNQAGFAMRPFTDYATEDCTNGNCDRRGAYLQAAAQLLVTDLEEMVANWEEGGAAREALLNGDSAAGISTMLTGMGSLSYGELAGERMKLGLLLGDPEEEHDCFSDNTHNSHLFDTVGIQNVYLGSYQRIDGTRMSGPSLFQLTNDKDSGAATELSGKLGATVAAMQEMAEHATTVEAYDQMIASGNDKGNSLIQRAIDRLVDQTKSIERVMAALQLGSLEIEGSDSLDNPGAVFE